MCCYLAAVFLPVAILLDSLNGYMKKQLEYILGKELIASVDIPLERRMALMTNFVILTIKHLLFFLDKVGILLDSLNGYMKEQLEYILGKELIASVDIPLEQRLALMTNIVILTTKHLLFFLDKSVVYSATL